MSGRHRPLVFSHRGRTQGVAGTEGIVENTLAAFEASRQLGADGVELDVRRSADWALVVHHDADLPDGRALAATPVRELPGHVPLLAEAMAACQPMVVNVEVKHDQGTDPDRALAAAVVSALQDGGWADRALVSSFDVRSIDLARDAGLRVGWLLAPAADARAALPQAVDQGYQALHPFVAQVDEALVAGAHEAGLAVNVWTVNAPEDLARMVELGVDAVITDRPAAVLAEVRRCSPNGEPAAG
ncbi:MAG TPA: glycerophosphodiester phosphodiesterase [Acidimicrobiales bacterium]|nr:glycerophosphodiester phosphodiesterase [Acidimicrobiales bacterium]